jgi:3-dehydroquinate synthase
MNLSFGEYKTDVKITEKIPFIRNVASDLNLNCDGSSFKPLLIADTNTSSIAKEILNQLNFPVCVVNSGEENKNWQSVEKILRCAHDSKLGRDAVFIAIGGGVTGDLAGFAASVYKRGCRFILVSTTLLGMVDASVGGKTGFDFLETKNLVGSFYPAEKVYMPLDTLSTLPQAEWKSGMAELIKTAVLCEDDVLFNLIFENKEQLKEYKNTNKELLFKLIEKAVYYKGGIVSEDPKETGTKRILLNLGHTFAHALESACGLGNISHGEAVAWGIVRACELGLVLGITPKDRAKKITELVASFDYASECPHPLASDAQILFDAMKNDKKNKNNSLRFIVPDVKSARPAIIEEEKDINTVMNILWGKINI